MNQPAITSIDPVLKFKQLRKTATAPFYASAGAACFDLAAACDDNNLPVTFLESVIIGTGLAVEIPKGHVMLVFSRSSHGFKNDVRLANCVGVIDSDYRGEVKVKLTNDSFEPMTISQGDRIAQAMLVQVDQWVLQEVDDLSATARGAGGFGSTGV